MQENNQDLEFDVWGKKQEQFSCNFIQNGIIYKAQIAWDRDAKLEDFSLNDFMLACQRCQSAFEKILSL